MRHASVLGLGLFGLALLFAPSTAKAQFSPGAPAGANSSPGVSLGGLSGGWDHKHNIRERKLEGFVRDANGKAVPNAVVYLKDTRNNRVESMNTDDHGAYRFGQLDLDADYQLWAQADKKKSASKTLSSFDTRDEVSLNLKIE